MVLARQHLLEEPPVRDNSPTFFGKFDDIWIDFLDLLTQDFTSCAAGYSLGFHLFHLLHNTQNISAQNLLDVAFGVTFCQQCRGHLR